MGCRPQKQHHQNKQWHETSQHGKGTSILLPHIRGPGSIVLTREESTVGGGTDNKKAVSIHSREVRHETAGDYPPQQKGKQQQPPDPRPDDQSCFAVELTAHRPVLTVKHAGGQGAY